MTQKKWLLTGAAGFLGSHVLENLIGQKQTVLAVDDLSWGKEAHLAPLKNSPNSGFKKIDIRDTAALTSAMQSFAPDIIVHLAALHFIPEAIKKPTVAVDINVRGTQSVLEAAAGTNYQTFWFASTGDVYAKTDKDNDESTTELKPFNIYGMSKFFGEKLLFMEHEKFAQRKFIAGRIYNLIGPHETNPHIVPEIMSQLKKNPKQLSLGNIHPIRDYVPVDQCAKAIIEMCQKINDPYTVCNVATGVGQSVKDLISKLEKVLGHAIDVQIDPARVRSVERERLVAAVGRLKKTIGWAPSGNVEDILRALAIEEGLLKK
jgi:UDP-glucose 4-epimerase